MKNALAAVAVAAFTLVAPGAQAGPSPYTSLVVFGDSLSDDGNNAAAGLYNPFQTVTGNTYVPTAAYGPSKTYSNGPVWATDFAAAIGVALAPSLLGGTDYAYGGATTGTPGPLNGPKGPGFPYSLLTQTSQYLAATGGVASASALYVVAGGGNDARAALNDAAADPGNAATIFGAAAAAFAANVGSIVDQLQAAGAQHILVWDTPDLGTAPAVIASGFAATGSFLAATMNAALTTRLTGEAGVSIFDIFGLGSAISASPSSFGFSNATDACGAVSGANCDQYVYWDGIHPTAAAHQVIADAVYAVAVPVPEPETWALLLVGLAVAGQLSRRSRRSNRVNATT